MGQAPSDSEVVARSLQEPTAFALILDRHFRSVHAYLHRRVGRDLADDLAAETFTVAFERRASCRATSTVLPWLFGIATNLLRHQAGGSSDASCARWDVVETTAGRTTRTRRRLTAQRELASEAEECLVVGAELHG
jgi:DNA-directed RNA polymerase specialized sigma24 family protein